MLSRVTSEETEVRFADGYQEEKSSSTSSSRSLISGPGRIDISIICEAQHEDQGSGEPASIKIPFDSD